MVVKYNVLKMLRSEFGITQEDIGRLIGCGRVNVSNKENGKVEWSYSEMIEIQNFFNRKLNGCEKDSLTLDQIFLPTMCKK